MLDSEGLDAQAGEHLLIADSAGDFAESTVRLLKEAGLRQKLAENAKKLVRNRYDWGGIMPSFLHLLAGISQK